MDRIFRGKLFGRKSAKHAFFLLKNVLQIIQSIRDLDLTVGPRSLLGTEDGSRFLILCSYLKTEPRQLAPNPHLCRKTLGTLQQATLTTFSYCEKIEMGRKMFGIIKTKWIWETGQALSCRKTLACWWKCIKVKFCLFKETIKKG